MAPNPTNASPSGCGWARVEGLDDGSRVATVLVPSHLGEVCQGCVKYRGELVTALITLPFVKGATATVKVAKATPTAPEGLFVDSEKSKAARAAKLAMRRLDIDRGYRVEIELRSDLGEGEGRGSSTAECTAGVMAIAHGAGRRISDAEVARLVWEAEGAADPLALLGSGSTPVWLSRKGRILSVITARLPDMVLVPFVTDRDVAVRTLSQVGKTVYSIADANEFSGVLRRATRAILNGDPHSLGAAGEASLVNNQKFCATARLSDLIKIARGTGGYLFGSHSGTAAALAFPAGIEGMDARVADVSDLLAAIGVVAEPAYRLVDGFPVTF